MPKNSRYPLLAALAVLAIAVSWLFAHRPSMQPVPSAQKADVCAERAFEGVSYIVCVADPAKHDVKLARLQSDGTPYRSLAKLADAAKAGRTQLLFAMNAGMYHEDLSPVGLYVEDAEEQATLQTGDGNGNFFLKPNGVFGVYSDGRPFVVTTEDYPLSQRAISFATQSGPMLVINGALHPKFEPDGKSRFVRNGVGIDGQGRAIFAISRQPVSFGSFARLFRDVLQCRNALYFDGVVSAFSDGVSTLVGGGYPAGPIAWAAARQAPLTQ